MPELRFALFVKLLTGVLQACFICSRLFLKFCLGKPTHPPGIAGRLPAHPMNNMCLYGDVAFVDYGTAARNPSMLELRFALFEKQLPHGTGHPLRL